MMKFLLLACLLGFVAADFQRAAAPAVHHVVRSFANGLHKSGSLRMSVGLPEAVELDKIESDMKDEIINKLKESLNDIIAKIKEHLDKGQVVSEQLLDKLKEIRAILQELGVGVSDIFQKYIDNLKGKAKELLEKLLKDLGIGKRHIARSTFRELIAELKEKILNNENIMRIREYIKNFVTNNPVLLKLKETLLKLKDVDLKELLKHLLDHVTHPQNSSITDLWEKIRDFFNKLNIKISEHYLKFAEWVISVWGKGLEVLKEKHGIITAIAMEFIEHAKDISAEVAREALEFFRPYKEELGDLWNQIVEIVKTFKD